MSGATTHACMHARGKIDGKMDEGDRGRAVASSLQRDPGSTCGRPRTQEETIVGCHAQEPPIALTMQKRLRPGTIYRSRDVALARLKTKLNRVGGSFS